MTLRYALDDEIAFTEEFDLPLGDPDRRLDEAERRRVDGLLSLLHWVAGVELLQGRAPAAGRAARRAPRRRRWRRCSRRSTREGLGELAYTNGCRAAAPALRARRRRGWTTARGRRSRSRRAAPRRVLVPVGGGKDSAVALEIVRRSGRELALFSIGDAPPIARTAAVAGLPHLIARRSSTRGCAR